METSASPLGVEPTAEAGDAGRLLAAGVATLVVSPALSWPLQGIVHGLGTPATAVRWSIGAVPDVVAVGLVVAGLRRWAQARQRPERVDGAVVAFVALVIGYLVVDQGLLAAGHDLFTGAPNGLYVQLVAARAAVVAPLLFVAIRSFRWPRPTIERLLDVVQVTAVVLALGAILEALFPDTWDHVGTDVLRLLEVRRDTYGVRLAPELVQYTLVGDRLLVRAGSFLLEFLQLGFLLIPGGTLALVRAARSLRAPDLLSLLAVTGGIVATLGRAAVLCAAVAFVLVLVTRRRGPERRRVQRLAVTAVAVFIVLAVATGLGSRFAATTEQGDESTSIHVDSSRAALEIIGHHPLGAGLGIGAAGSARPHPGGGLTSENAYLDVGIQVGLLAVAALVASVVVILTQLWRRREAGDEVVVALAGVIALALGGMVLHTWQMLETTWLVFALAAIALPRVERAA